MDIPKCASYSSELGDLSNANQVRVNPLSLLLMSSWTKDDIDHAFKNRIFGDIISKDELDNRHYCVGSCIRHIFILCEEIKALVISKLQKCISASLKCISERIGWTKCTIIS